jgi:hypothetical protein
MSRKPRVQRTPEEKRQIVLEGLKSSNVAETCLVACPFPTIASSPATD